MSNTTEVGPFRVDQSQNLNAATIRTALPAGWALVLTWLLMQLAQRFGWDVTTADIEALVPLLVAVLAAVYRVLRWVEVRWPRLAIPFLGSGRRPLVYMNNSMNGLKFDVSDVEVRVPELRAVAYGPKGRIAYSDKPIAPE